MAYISSIYVPAPAKIACLRECLIVKILNFCIETSVLQRKDVSILGYEIETSFVLRRDVFINFSPIETH